jgi:hypothetical protein
MTELLQFLLENNDIRIHNNKTLRDLEADEAYKIGGEFVVYSVNGKELYRGDDFEKALEVLNET